MTTKQLLFIKFSLGHAIKVIDSIVINENQELSPDDMKSVAMLVLGWISESRNVILDMMEQNKIIFPEFDEWLKIERGEA